MSPENMPSPHGLVTHDMLASQGTLMTSRDKLKKIPQFVADVLLGRRPLTDARAILDYQQSLKKPLVELEITSRCNTACRCCTRDPLVVGLPMNLTMSVADVMHILEPYTPSTIRGIALSGSESLLHPEFFEIVESIAQRFPLSQVQLYTNGIVLASDKNTLEKVGDLGFESITFSLHGATQETVSLLQPGVTIEGALTAAEYLSKNSNSVLWATFVVQDANVDEIPAFVELVASSGFRGLSFVPYNRSDVTDDTHDYESEWRGMDLWTKLNAAKARAEELGVLYASAGGLCSCTDRADIYRANGAVLTCSGNSRSEYVVGNALSESFSKIAARRRRVMKKTLAELSAGCTPTMCRACALRDQQSLP